MNEIFELNGLTFKAEIESCTDMGPPWKEHDGHGVVSDWTTRERQTYERVLAESNGSKRYYHYRESIDKANRESWGLSPEDVKALSEKLGREPTNYEIHVEAVERDFQRLRAWCNDEWCWCGVVVTLLDVDGDETDRVESLWGIESDAGDYLDEVAKELAAEIARHVGEDSVVESKQTWVVRK